MKHQHISFKSYFLLFLASLYFLSSCAIIKARHKNPTQVGEIVPCSARVAKKVTETIDQDRGPKTILEIGAGSGALTGHIINKMTAKDVLDLIEIEPILCDELKNKFGQIPNVHIHCVDFLQFTSHDRYDYIVSSLPYNSFPPKLTQALIDHMLHLADANAYISFVEIKWFPMIKSWFLNQENKKQYQENREIINNLYNKYHLYSTSVYMNFPPIIVHHLRLKR